MSAQPSLKEEKRPSAFSPSLIGWIMSVLAIVLPFIVQISGTGVETDFTVAATAWMYQNSSYNTGFRFFTAQEWLASMLFTLPRLLFAYQMYRYYQEKTTRMMTVLAGVFSELPVALVMTALLFWNAVSPTPSFLPTVVPIPILITVGFLMIWKRPTFVPTGPWD
ncbi:MAG: hypothetical protein ACFFFC_16420 [Candidatus Thorarchaeota archaeon]